MELIEQDGKWVWTGKNGWQPYKSFNTREEAIEFHSLACSDTGNPEENAEDAPD